MRAGAVAVVATVERVAASPDGHLAVQAEERVAWVHRDGRGLEAIVERRNGEDLVSVLPGGRALIVDAEMRLQVVGRAGEVVRREGAFSEDAEFVDARVVPDGTGTAVMIAEMVGPRWGLGVPRFRFVFVPDPLAAPVEVRHEWSSRPRLWAVLGGRRLLAESGVGDGLFLEFDLDSGGVVARRRLAAFEPLTGLDAAADGNLVLVSHEGAAGRTLLRRVRTDGTVAGEAELPGATGTEPQPLWSSACDRLVVRHGAERAAELYEWMPSDAQAAPRSLGAVRWDSAVAWAGPTLVVSIGQMIRFLDFDVPGAHPSL